MVDRSEQDPNPDNMPEEIIKVHAAGVDVGQIMAEIRERIRDRRAELGYEKMVFPSYGGVVYPGKPDDIPYDANLYHHLKLSNKIYAEAETGSILVESPATRVPLLGKIWSMIRGHAHDLVLFYVNRAVNHQTEVNRHLVSVLNLLTVENQRQQRAIMELEDEVARLKAEAEL